MLPSLPVCHLIIPEGATLTIWTPRDDRPGWAMVTVEPIHGYWEATRPNDWAAALRSPLGLGSALLLPSDTSPPPRSATLTTAPTDIRLALGDAATFWYQTQGRTRWYSRTLMANANSTGIRLTAGHGGRGRRGALKMSAAGPTQEPPATSWDARALVVKVK